MQVEYADGEIEGCHHLHLSETRAQCKGAAGETFTEVDKDEITEIHGLGGLTISERGEQYASSCHGGLKINNGRVSCVGSFSGPNDEIDWDDVDFIFEG